jgi:hypothetical protein
MISLVIMLGIWFGLCVVPVMLTLFDDDDEVEYSELEFAPIGGGYDLNSVGEEEEEEEEGVETGGSTRGGSLEMSSLKASSSP